MTSTITWLSWLSVMGILVYAGDGLNAILGMLVVTNVLLLILMDCMFALKDEIRRLHGAGEQ